MLAHAVFPHFTLTIFPCAHIFNLAKCFNPCMNYQFLENELISTGNIQLELPVLIQELQQDFSRYLNMYLLNIAIGTDVGLQISENLRGNLGIFVNSYVMDTLKLFLLKLYEFITLLLPNQFFFFFKFPCLKAQFNLSLKFCLFIFFKISLG